MNDELLTQRYGLPTTLDGALNATLTTLFAHRSIRAYTAAPVDDQTLALIVAAAQSASSSSNLQAWSVVAVRDQARKERLSVVAGDQAHIRECPLLLLWIADLARLRLAAQQHDLPAQGLDYFELFLVAAIDAALAAQNASVAAESLGLGIVYIGGMRNRPEEVAAEIALPPGAFVVFGLCVGYPDTTRPAAIKPRLPQQAVLHHERYTLATQPAQIELYNDVMAAFYARGQMKTHGTWAEHSARRVAGPQSLSGRDRLRAALTLLGFPLK
ncbi:NADPH-dependent oxidoreductase [Candidatus Gracilibacteria bacterium]|nr:NADPH-dependent oxidoreductase [Candidatus Gracilibacteria bacterium]